MPWSHNSGDPALAQQHRDRHHHGQDQSNKQRLPVPLGQRQQHKR
jgi:hypothetical protein